MDKTHILIVGERGAGKSTLIQKLLQCTVRPVGGFITKSLPPDESGFHPIYIHPAGQEIGQRSYTPENLIGTCDTKIHNVNQQAFDTFGVTYLSDLPADGVVVMDELGFMETASPAFMKKVMETLDGEVPVLAAVKNRKDISFLTDVCGHPKASVFYLTEENREELFETLRTHFLEV